MFKQVKILFLYTETPLHVGSGSSLGTVDLPIQRERHTELPMIQSTGIKGKIRSVFDNNGLDPLVFKAIFGPESGNASDHAGALSPGDGRILLFPIRSLAGVFAWITCPLVLSRFQRDLQLAGETPNWTIPTLDNTQALIPNSSQLVIDNAVVLEEFSFISTPNEQVTTLANWLADNALPDGSEYEFWRGKLKKDLVVVSDDVFKDFCKFSTDVVSRTELDREKKIVKKRALWTEENLPSDSLLYTPLFACDPRMDKAVVPKIKDNKGEDTNLDAASILNLIQTHFTNGHKRLQLGGNETVGRGIVATRVLD
jgi:CRISPR-associated protein Cmr4